MVAPATQPEELELLAMGDSIGPQSLEVSRIGAARLQAALTDEYTTADTVANHFLVIKTLSDEPRVLYRAGTSDTVWTELDSLLGHYEHGDQQQDVQIRQANLDGQGRPEALVSFYSAIYGSGGGSTYTSCYLLDVTNTPPRLLLQTSTSFVMEAFPAYAAMHGDTLDNDFEEYQGFKRSVKLRPREVVMGTIKRQGHPEASWRSYLTQLPAGRYRYQQGRMYRVRH